MVVRYSPDCVGRHLVALRFPNGHTMDYPIAVSDARAVRLIKGFDLGARDFSPRLSAGTECRLNLSVDETLAGPGRLESEVTQVDGDRQDNTKRKAEVIKVAENR